MDRTVQHTSTSGDGFQESLQKWGSTISPSSTRTSVVKENPNFNNILVRGFIQQHYSLNHQLKVEVSAVKKGLKEMKDLLVDINRTNGNHILYNVKNMKEADNHRNGMSTVGTLDQNAHSRSRNRMIPKIIVSSSDNIL